MGSEVDSASSGQDPLGALVNTAMNHRLP